MRIPYSHISQFLNLGSPTRSRRHSRCKGRGCWRWIAWEQNIFGVKREKKWNEMSSRSGQLENYNGTWLYMWPGIPSEFKDMRIAQQKYHRKIQNCHHRNHVLDPRTARRLGLHDFGYSWDNIRIPIYLICLLWLAHWQTIVVYYWAMAALSPWLNIRANHDIQRTR